MENHSNINNQFIPYNLALELKDLGFNEECFGWYSPVMNGLLIYCNSTNDGTEEKYCTAPLWQQVWSFLDDNGVLYPLQLKKQNLQSLQ